MQTHSKCKGRLFAWALFATLVAVPGTGLWSQPVDPVVLGQIREHIAQIRHPDQVDMLAQIRVFAPGNPEAYIMAIADQPTSVPGLRLRAYGLLARFDQSTPVRNFLEARVENAGLNETFRQMAITSFVRAFYVRDPAGVERVLNRVSGDRSRVVRSHALRVLENMRRGVRHPAGR